MNRDRDLPWSPGKRDLDLEKQFSQELYFVEEPQGKKSYWAQNPKLERRFKQLIKDHPAHEKIDWLIYFLNRIRSAQDYELAERQLSLNHFACFYQLEFYYAARELHRKYPKVRQLYHWESLFDAIADPFVTLETAQKALQKFNPVISTKKYIQILCERRGRDWLRKQCSSDLITGPNSGVTSLDPLMSDPEKQGYGHQQKIFESATDLQETYDAQAKLKQDQHQLWQLVVKYLEIGRAHV